MLGTNSIKGLNGKNGGAILIQIDLNIKAEYSPIKYTISGLTISNCQASLNGGAIYLENLYMLNISSSSFTNNKAVNGSGGAIYFKCN
jgi:predicted outer membrane repeat protein